MVQLRQWEAQLFDSAKRESPCHKRAIRMASDRRSISPGCGLQSKALLAMARDAQNVFRVLLQCSPQAGVRSCPANENRGIRRSVRRFTGAERHATQSSGLWTSVAQTSKEY